MLSAPHYANHAEQQAAPGCAAALDPIKHPRRHALQKARERVAKESKAITKHETPDEYRAALSYKARAKRMELAARAAWYSDLTMAEAAAALDISYAKLQKLKAEFDLRFKPAQGAAE